MWSDTNKHCQIQRSSVLITALLSLLWLTFYLYVFPPLVSPRSGKYCLTFLITQLSYLALLALINWRYRNTEEILTAECSAGIPHKIISERSDRSWWQSDQRDWCNSPGNCLKGFYYQEYYIDLYNHFWNFFHFNLQPQLSNKNK